MDLNESKIDVSKKWYFGNNRSENLKLSRPAWYAPFFLTTNYQYAEDYADYGVYSIDLKPEVKSKILDFNSKAEVAKLKWPRCLVDKIQAGQNDLNSLAYDMYILAYNTGNELMYIDDSTEWKKAASYFKSKSVGIFSQLKRGASMWGDENDHAFVLQMWKDIYDAGFDGFVQVEFGSQVLAIFDFKCFDKISIYPVNNSLDEEEGISNNEVYLSNMAKSFADKAWFLKMVPNDVTTIVDFGGCTGDFAKFCRQKLPDHTYVIVDNNPDFSDEAKANGFMTASSLEQLKGKINFGQSLLILSSVIHEIYSYADPNSFWKSIAECGFRAIAIRDMSYDEDAMRNAPIDSIIWMYENIFMSDKMMFKGKPFREITQSFEDVWGAICDPHARKVNGKNLFHFLIKYRYQENWSREVQENYLPVSKEKLSSILSSMGYSFTHKESSKLAFYGKCWKKDFKLGIPDNDGHRKQFLAWLLTLDTHIKWFLQKKIMEDKALNENDDICIDKQQLNEDYHAFYDIDKDDNVVTGCKNPIGKIGISIYDDIHAVGIGSFEIFKPYRRANHARKTLQKLVNALKDRYDLVYCFVDKDNFPAISLYNSIGKVSRQLNSNGQYMVELWKNNVLNENKAAYLKKYAGEDDVGTIVEMFWHIRNRLNAPQNDIDWWINKPFADLKRFVQNFDPSNKRQRRDADYKQTAFDNDAQLLDTKDGYEIWYVPTYEAMRILGRFYKGRSAKWCVASDDPEFWFDNHDEDEFILLIREKPQHDEFDKIAIQMEHHGRYYREDDFVPWDLENNDWTFTNDELIKYAWSLFKDNGELRQECI